jgi:hypothetical protein
MITSNVKFPGNYFKANPEDKIKVNEPENHIQAAFSLLVKRVILAILIKILYI